MKSPLGWVGGKFFLVKELLKLVPQHKVYVEPFGGAAHLLFAKDPAMSDLEVYNDIDSGLVNFFRVLRDEEKAKKLIEKVYLTPYSREEFYFCRDTWESCEDEVERAYRWLVVAKMSFAGCFGTSWGFNLKMKDVVQRWSSMPEKLIRAVERLKFVQVENRDFREIFKLYDSEDTFFYCDPPYVPEARKLERVYRYEMFIEDHKDLISIILNVKGKVLLSGYDNGLYKVLEENGWKRKSFKVKCLSQKKKGEEKEERVECVWMNYNIEKERGRSLFLL